MTKKHGKKHEQTPESGMQPVETGAGAANETEPRAAETCSCGTVKPEAATEYQAEKSEASGTAPTKESDSAADGVKKETPDAERIAALEAKCRDLQDQYLRKAADFDNYRKRMIREKQEAIDYANTNLLSDLLQILDDFDRALEAGGKSEEGGAAAVVQGVAMIRSGLLTLLESKYGLLYYEVQGKVFNPEIHEAVATNPSTEVTEPTVGAELQKGYKLKERILRPAKVMVLMPQPAETA